MSQTRTPRLRRTAFSLLEMMLVVVIIGLLAGVVVFQFAGQGEKARIGATKTKMRSVQQAIETYLLENGNVPADLTVLTGGTQPLLPTYPKDAWKNELVYYPQSDIIGKQYTLLSIGKDGQEGTEDDIDLWVTEQDEG